MALVSLSVKHHLGEEFPIAPPSPPQSPIFCSSQMHLLSSLHTSSSLSETQPKKRRKQEHPLFLTDSHFTADGVSESSADEMEKFQVQESRTKAGVNPSNHVDREKVGDAKAVHSNGPKNQVDINHFRDEHVGVDERRDTQPDASLSFEEKSAKPGSHLTSDPNVPLMLLSQVASDVMGHLSSSSPFKSQPEVLTYLKQEEEFVTESHVPSDGELPSGDPVAEGGAEICPDCKKVFKRKIYLQRHIAREHWSLAKIFKCEKCAYETKHQSNLLVHRRTHTGERPYHCGACGQRYTQGHLLKAHIRSRHGADMRFYNMDKRTDGIRCRRLIGTKLIGGGKEDRIRFLLQAAEAARHHPSPPSPSRPMFGAMMSPSLNQYMNVLSCLPSGLRPVLWPSLSGGLLGTSGGFPSTPLQNGMPSHAALLSSLAAPLSLTGGTMLSKDFHSKASGSLLSSMLALPSSVASLQAIKSENFPGERVSSKMLTSSPDRSAMQGSFAVPVDFPMMPEDLTTTKRGGAATAETASPEKAARQSQDKGFDIILQGRSLGFGLYPLSLTHNGSSNPVSAADMSGQDVSQNHDSMMSLNGNDLKVLPDEPLRVFQSPNEKNNQNFGPTKSSSHQSAGENVMLSWSNTKLPSLPIRSEQFPESSQSRHMAVDINNIYASQNHTTLAAEWNRVSTSHLQVSGGTVQSVSEDQTSHSSPSKAVGEEAALESKMDTGHCKAVSNGHSKCSESIGACKEACCPYLKKLKDLRRNVYRMLCVFTPYLGVANINDYEADSIDEFLHEVIYSKLDDTD